MADLAPRIGLLFVTMVIGFLLLCFLFPWDWSSNENFNGFVWGRPGFAQPVCLWVHLIVISQLDAPWSIALSRSIRRN